MKATPNTTRLVKLTAQYHADEAARSKSYRALRQEISRLNQAGLGLGRISPIVGMSKAQVGRICEAERGEA